LKNSKDWECRDDAIHEMVDQAEFKVEAEAGCGEKE